MKVLPAAVCSVTLLASAVIAQSTPPPISLVTDPLGPLQRLIPAEVGSSNALQVVRFDPDGDLLLDLAIRWADGTLTYGNAPEVMTAFVDVPAAAVGSLGVTGMARIPAGFALAGAVPHDALLVADGTELRYLTYDPVQARSAPGATGFAGVAVAASSAWQQVVRVDSHATPGALWLVGLGADLRQVLVGEWTATGIVEVGAFVAGDVVREVLCVDFANDGALQVAVRTNSALEFRTIEGALARPVIAAPTASAYGGLACLDVGGGQRVAWLCNSGPQWLLRVYDATTQRQNLVVEAPGLLPTRFRPVGLAAVDLGGPADALVICQSSTENQLVCTVNEAGEWHPTSSFPCPGMTYPVDNCPPIVDDLDHDGAPDCTIVLSSMRRVQVHSHLAPPPAMAMPGPGSVDILPVDCRMVPGPTGVPNTTIELNVEVPSAYLPIPALELQVVAWPHYVTEPLSANSPSEPVGDAVANVFYTLTTNGQSWGPTPVVPLTLPRTTTGSWTANEHFYFMLRFVQREGAALVWTSPARMVAFVAHDGYVQPSFPGELNYLHSIIEPSSLPDLRVDGDRNVGVILKPITVKPPNSTVTVPNAGPTTQQTPSGSW